MTQVITFDGRPSPSQPTLKFLHAHLQSPVRETARGETEHSRVLSSPLPIGNAGSGRHAGVSEGFEGAGEEEDSLHGTTSRERKRPRRIREKE